MEERRFQKVWCSSKKGGQEMSDIKGSKLLRKLVPDLLAAMQSENTWVNGVVGNGWQVVNPGVAGLEYLVWRGYFDIAGWSSEKLSAFIQGAGFQQADSVFMSVPAQGTGKEWCIISKASIPDEAFSAAYHNAPATTWYAPGMLGSNYDLQEIFTGRFREFSHDANTPYSGIITSQSVWGAGDATAGDKIYITIALRGFGFTTGTAIHYPPTSVVVPATLIDEKDLVYLERLRRSYVLAESRNP